jgi:hypothetical protein
MTDSEILLLEVFIEQVIAAALGTASTAVADWLYHIGRIRKALHSVCVSCSVTAIFSPMIAWTSSVFLGSGVFSKGLFGMLAVGIFLSVQRKLAKFPSLQKSGLRLADAGLIGEQRMPTSSLASRMQVPGDPLWNSDLQKPGDHPRSSRISLLRRKAVSNTYRN